jgi:hypothetical protein
MLQRRSLARSFPFVLVVLLLASCSSSNEAAGTTATTTTTEATPTTTSAPTTTAAPTTTEAASTTTTDPAASEEPVFDVAFDGTTCTVVGPSQVPPGTYSFLLTDTSGFRVEVGAIRAGDGHSYEDLLALQAAPTETFSFPPWVSLAMFSFAPMSRDLADNEVRLILDTGEYGIGLVRSLPEAKWFCARISVTEQ